MKLISIAPVLALLVGCGGAVPPAEVPASNPATTSTTAATAPVAEAEAAVAPTPAPATPTPAPEPVAEVPEKCDGGWVCVKISFATRKVEPRDTRLTGEQSTWSKQSDGRTATFDQFSKGPVELTLRRKGGNKNEVVVKVKGGGELVIDRHDGSNDDFTHIGAIATEKDGALYIDMRYMR
jgi:hypothetical protein